VLADQAGMTPLRLKTTITGWLAAAACAPAAIGATATAAGPACQARSPDHQVPLVELYTSEGCSSCPPADRWLSTLKGQPQVLAAAFHVDYWDRLGWPDRFGSARHTERQAAQVKASGARFAYTPQVLLNGRDWRGWPVLPLQAAPARVRVQLVRLDAGQVQVSVGAEAGAPRTLGLWWAVLEDGHHTAVGAGENQGVRLQHDHVVRRYEAVSPWPALPGAAAQVLRLPVPQNGEAGRKARLLVVVTDAATGAPLQATGLDCPVAAARPA
jgi:hypothetical protein